MRKIVLNALAGAVALGVLLAAAAVLILSTEYAGRITRPFLHALADLAELLGGVPILMGALYISTRAAVGMFARSPESRRAASIRGE